MDAPKLINFGHLTVRVQRALIPDNTELGGIIDPYCVVTCVDPICGERTHRTHVSDDHQDAVFTWDATLTFLSVSSDCALRLALFDKDLGSSDDPIGMATLPLSELAERLELERSEDGHVPFKIDVERGGERVAQLRLTLSPQNAHAAERKLTTLLEQCVSQEERLRQLHAQLQRQLNLFSSKLSELQGKEGRDDLAFQYQDEIRRFRDQQARLEALFNTIWRKRMFLQIRRPLILLHKRILPPLRLPRGEMDRDASATYLGRLNAQIVGLAAVSREAGQVERKIRARLELNAAQLDPWIDDDTRVEINIDRATLADAYAELGATVRADIKRHNLARDHLEFQLLKMSRPVLDLSFIQDDLEATIDATDLSDASAPLGETDVALLLEAVQDPDSTSSLEGEDALMDDLAAQLAANLDAVAELEAALR